MKSITEQTLEYFSASNNAFWKWAENGEVIEWATGGTICYREDLTTILKRLEPYGVPPLGSVLLIMAACQNRWKDTDGIQIIYKQSNIGFEKKRRFFLNDYMESSFKFLDLINELPKELRTGSNRTHLFQEIFKGEADSYISPPHGVIDEFLSGRLDASIFLKKKKKENSDILKEYRRILLCITRPSRRFPTAEYLELAVRTGLTEIPKPIDLERKEEKDNEEISLLNQLKEDRRTEGIARLCQRIIAGLNIPMHSQGVSDQSFGGVSDITNRGDIDKLLLSELAYDDTTLMVRLANNEAMYLRREELPSNLHKERIILMDSTIKMWGIPRVFATSVALACAIQDKNVASIQSYLLSGEENHEIDFSSKEGVIQSLEELHPELNCADALDIFVEEKTITEQTELILITNEQSLQNEDFKKTINDVRSALTYLITVNREGRLHFYEYNLSGRRLVSTTLYDLNELLFAREEKEKSILDRTVSDQLPLIYQQKPFPIFYPSPSIRFKTEDTFEVGKESVAVTTKDNRLLFWEKKGVGARELLGDCEFCDKYEIIQNERMVYVLVTNIKEVNHAYKHTKRYIRKWYAFDLLDDSRSFEIDFSEKEIFARLTKAMYGTFYFMDFENKIFFIDEESGEINPCEEEIHFTNRKKPNFSKVKKIVNNGYTTLRKPKELRFICSETLLDYPNGLQLNGWELKFGKHGIWFNKTEKKLQYYNYKRFQELSDLSLGETLFKRIVFRDGSQVIADTKGLLHLISSDKNIPQVTVPMRLGGYTAAWASDGVVAGASYFIGKSNPNQIGPEEFQQQYIQPFFNKIAGK